MSSRPSKALYPDTEQALLTHLAELKLGEGVGAAADIHALRNVIGNLFA